MATSRLMTLASARDQPQAQAQQNGAAGFRDKAHRHTLILQPSDPGGVRHAVGRTHGAGGAYDE